MLDFEGNVVTIKIDGKAVPVTEVDMPGIPAAWLNVDGYGKGRFPTPYRIRFRNRWHRVYAATYSNSSSFFVEVKRKPVFVYWQVEQALEDFRDSQR